jgi:hypothetical protein
LLFKSLESCLVNYFSQKVSSELCSTPKVGEEKWYISAKSFQKCWFFSSCQAPLSNLIFVYYSYFQPISPEIIPLWHCSISARLGQRKDSSPCLEESQRGEGSGIWSHRELGAGCTQELRGSTPTWWPWLGIWGADDLVKRCAYVCVVSEQ